MRREPTAAQAALRPLRRLPCVRRLRRPSGGARSRSRVVAAARLVAVRASSVDRCGAAWLSRRCADGLLDSQGAALGRRGRRRVRRRRAVRLDGADSTDVDAAARSSPARGRACVAAARPQRLRRRRARRSRGERRHGAARAAAVPAGRRRPVASDPRRPVDRVDTRGPTAHRATPTRRCTTTTRRRRSPASSVGSAVACPPTGERLRALLPLPARRGAGDARARPQRAADRRRRCWWCCSASSPGWSPGRSSTPVRLAAPDRRAARRRPARGAHAGPRRGRHRPARRRRSTRWRPACSARSASSRSCRGCSAGSSPTSPTSCARRSPPCGWPPTCCTTPASGFDPVDRPVAPSCCRPSSTGSRRCSPTCSRSAGSTPAPRCSTSTTSTSPTSRTGWSTRPGRSPSSRGVDRGACDAPERAVPGRGRRPPGRADRAQPGHQRHRARRGPAESSCTVAGDDQAAAIAVRDHGVGPRARARSALVFNRFWRADPARARTSGGTGLGLSIALEDAHLHGGWLQAWGQPGDGAQFRLTLPRRAGDGAAAQPAAAGARPTSRSRSHAQCSRRLPGRAGGAAGRVLVCGAALLAVTGCVRMPDDGPVVETSADAGDRVDERRSSSTRRPPQRGRLADRDRRRLPRRDDRPPRSQTTVARQFLTARRRAAVEPRPG